MPGRRGRAREREDGRGARRASSCARRASPTPSSTLAPTGRRGSTSTARSRSPASGPSSRARSGRARSARATSCGSSRPAATSASAASRCTTATSSAREAGQRVAVSLPGVERRDVATGRGARRARRVCDLVPPRRRARGDRADRGRRARSGAPRHGARARARRAPRRALRAAAARAAGRRGSRRPRDPARRDDARWRSRRRPDAAAPSRRVAGRATRGRRRRGDDRMRPSASTRCGSSSTATLEGVERAGPWVFSASWLAVVRARAPREDRRGRPDRPGDPAAVRAVGRRRPPAPAVRAARREAVPCRVRSRRSRVATSDAAALEARLAAAGVRATKVEDDELARFLEASGRLVRLGDGYAIGADAFEVAKDVLLSGVPRDRRDHARALPRPRRDGTARRAAPPRALRRGRLTRRDGERRVLRRAAVRGPR